MRIEAVTVCVGYGDFLAVTVRENQYLLDDLVVVTSPDDAVATFATIRIITATRRGLTSSSPCSGIGASAGSCPR